MIKKDLILFGYTGSIGKQTLEVLKSFDCPYQLIGIVSHSNTDNLKKTLKDFPLIKSVGTVIEKKIEFEGKYYFGQNLLNIINDNSSAAIFNAVSGIAGIEVTLHAIEHDRIVFLANKESVVVGYSLLKEALKKHPKSRLIPIDSEHSALAKLLKQKDDVTKLYITCSGGALRDYPLSDIGKATVKEVLNHPTWNMGKKITVDCATLVNKAYEVIEAKFFFDFPLNKIEVIMHDESIIHAMTLMKDNSVVAELASSDMRIPISYALHDEERVEGNYKEFQLCDLHFRKFDERRYPLFNFILNNFDERSTAMAIISAADEVAINSFINGEISYKDIYTIIVNTFKSMRQEMVSSIDDILHACSSAKEVAEEIKREIEVNKRCKY